jgi:hypothetical protein
LGHALIVTLIRLHAARSEAEGGSRAAADHAEAVVVAGGDFVVVLAAGFCILSCGGQRACSRLLARRVGRRSS